MVPNFSRCLGLRMDLILGCLCLTASAALAQSQTTPLQTEPVNEPRSAQHEPSGPPIAKGAAAITQQEAKCSTRLIVSADALFKPGRWTLNPDGAETMSALAPLVVKAGKHPVRIEAYVASAAPEHQNQVVAQRRAITVRGWLRNSGYVPVDTPVEGFGKHLEDPSIPNAAKTADNSESPDGAPKDQRVEVVFDTCH